MLYHITKQRKMSMNGEILNLIYMFSAALAYYIALNKFEKTQYSRTAPLSISLATTIVVRIVFSIFFGSPSEKTADWIIEGYLCPIMLVTGIVLGLDVIKRQWKAILLGGTMYVVLASIGAGILYYYHVPMIIPAIFAGTAISMSDTLVGHGRIEEIGIEHRAKGKFAISILLSQDSILIPISMLAYGLKHAEGNVTLGLSIVGYFLLGIVVFLLAVAFEKYFFVGKLIGGTTGNEEKDQRRTRWAAMVIILGTCILGLMLANASLSVCFLIAGLMIFDSKKKSGLVDFCHQVTEYALPLLLATLVQKLDFELLKEEWLWNVGCLLIVPILKILVGFTIGMMFKFGARTSLRIGGVLATMGASSILVAEVAHKYHHISEQLFQTVIMLVVVSMIGFPLIITLLGKLTDHLPEHEVPE